MVAVNDSFMVSFLKRHSDISLYSVFTTSVDATFNWLRAQGLRTDAPRSGRVNVEIPKGWSWDDGGAQWRSIALNTKDSAAYLPVL